MTAARAAYEGDEPEEWEELGGGGPGEGAVVSPFTPDAVVVGARHLELDGDWVASLAVTGYPREVSAGWLSPLTSYPGRLDVSLHIEPVTPAVAASRLRRQLSRLESERRHRSSYGRVEDPNVEAAAEDASELSHRIARGEARLFRVGLYLTIHAESEPELADEVAALRALTASLLLDAVPTTFRSLQGWVSTLPVGLDRIRMCRTFDTDSLAAAFPMDIPELPAPDPAAPHEVSGVFYGYSLGSGGLVFRDRFDPRAHNYNQALLGRSGAGKSYLLKAEVLRSLYRGVEVAVIDPENEYARLADAVGGVVLRLGAPGVRLNPLDLPTHHDRRGRLLPVHDALNQASLFTQTVVAAMLDFPLSPAARAALDRAIALAYRRAGLSPDPRTWLRPAPSLREVRDELARHGDPSTAHPDPGARELAHQLTPFVDGSRGGGGGLFDGPTTLRPEGQLVVFSLRELPDELRAVGTLLALDAIWRRVTDPSDRRPRMVTVDEAWLLMRDAAGARFLARLAKAARRHWCGLTLATQDSDDLLSTELGRAVISNAATQILLRQAPQAITQVSKAFTLSEGEARFLLHADRGHGLLLGGEHRVAFASLASDTEHDLITSNPADLADDLDGDLGSVPSEGPDYYGAYSDPDTDGEPTYSEPTSEQADSNARLAREFAGRQPPEDTSTGPEAPGAPDESGVPDASWEYRGSGEPEERGAGRDRRRPGPSGDDREQRSR